MPDITQEDREFAARCAVLEEMRELIRAGRCDESEVVQAAARHRESARARALEEAARCAEDYPSNDGSDIKVIRGIAYAIRNLAKTEEG